jgi:hypothetical protein
LRAPGTILVGRAIANRLLGEVDPVGETITVMGGEYTISGVLRDPPRNASYVPWFITIHLPEKYHRPYWLDWRPILHRPAQTYVLLRKGADPAAAQAKIQTFIGKYLGPDYITTETYHLINLPVFERSASRSLLNPEEVKAEFLRHSNVLGATAVHGSGVLRAKPTTATALADGNRYSVYLAAADEDAASVYGFQFARGRGHRSRTVEIVINEAAARTLGEAGEIGNQLKWVGDRAPGTIVGVVKDYHYQSLHHPIRPLILYHNGGPHHVTLKVSPEGLQETIAFLRETWTRLIPNHPFEFGFVTDDRIDRLYRAEQRIGSVSRATAGLTIFVACLGLLGLSTFAAERRAKEIGIRKVLGASVASLLNLLSYEFLRLILVSNVIAWPIGYWIARRFLDSFAYRVDLGIDVFILSGILGLFLALVTVSLRTLGAARADPVRVLRAD